MHIRTPYAPHTCSNFIHVSILTVYSELLSSSYIHARPAKTLANFGVCSALYMRPNMLSHVQKQTYILVAALHDGLQETLISGVARAQPMPGHSMVDLA